MHIIHYQVYFPALHFLAYGPLMHITPFEVFFTNTLPNDSPFVYIFYDGVYLANAAPAELYITYGIFVVALALDGSVHRLGSLGAEVHPSTPVSLWRRSC